MSAVLMFKHDYICHIILVKLCVWFSRARLVVAIKGVTLMLHAGRGGLTWLDFATPASRRRAR